MTVEDEKWDDEIPHPGNFDPNGPYLKWKDASDSAAWWEEHLGCAADSHKRYKICQECPHFIDATKQCKLCMCFMFIKCRIPYMECPDTPPRWGKSERLKKS
tara:strand:+ start:123 stop:428 length:306 start_codon:yes stop_codon:yes gene_type:complete